MLSMRHNLIIFLIGISALSSCSSHSKQNNSEFFPELNDPSGPSEAESKKRDAEQEAENVVITIKPNGKSPAPQKAESAPVITPPVLELKPVSDKDFESMKAEIESPVLAPSGKTPGSVPWSKALGWLKNGNTRFQKGRFRSDGQSIKDVKRLSNSESPHSIVLSCSDSRVPPELIFDEKLGEIFVVRVAGEILNFGTIGSIEHAVQNLGSNLILVMGHTSCGAIKAAHETPKGSSLGSPHLDLLVADIQPRISTYAGQPASPGHVKESWANVKGIAKDLMDRSPLVAAAVQSGNLKIAEAMYDTSSGVVTFW